MTAEQERLEVFRDVLRKIEMYFVALQQLRERGIKVNLPQEVVEEIRNVNGVHREDL